QEGAPRCRSTACEATNEQSSGPPDRVIKMGRPAGPVELPRVPDKGPAFPVPLNLRRSSDLAEPRFIGSGQPHPVHRLSGVTALVVLVRSPGLDDSPSRNTRRSGPQQRVAILVRRLDLGENQDVHVPAIQQAHPHTARSEEHTSELQSRENLVCRLLLEKKKKQERKRQRT